jgi:hypothetical protein
MNFMVVMPHLIQHNVLIIQRLEHGNHLQRLFVRVVANFYDKSNLHMTAMAGTIVVYDKEHN